MISPPTWAFVTHKDICVEGVISQWVSQTHRLSTVTPINPDIICCVSEKWSVTYSPSSDSLSESWLMMSFLCSSACSRAAWSFRGNSEASSSIYKQLKALQSPEINSIGWRISFKAWVLLRTACFTACLQRDAVTAGKVAAQPDTFSTFTVST